MNKMLRYFAISLLAVVLFTMPARAQNNARFSEIKPGMVDEQLEEQAIKIANERAVNFRCPERYTKAVILSYKWHNEVDAKGFVTARNIHMELYCERPGETCGMADFTFMQKHELDDVFTRKLFFVHNGNMYGVPCE